MKAFLHPKAAPGSVEALQEELRHTVRNEQPTAYGENDVPPVHPADPENSVPPHVHDPENDVPTHVHNPENDEPPHAQYTVPAAAAVPAVAVPAAAVTSGAPASGRVVKSTATVASTDPERM